MSANENPLMAFTPSYDPSHPDIASVPFSQSYQNYQMSQNYNNDYNKNQIIQVDKNFQMGKINFSLKDRNQVIPEPTPEYNKSYSFVPERWIFDRFGMIFIIVFGIVFGGIGIGFIFFVLKTKLTIMLYTFCFPFICISLIMLMIFKPIVFFIINPNEKTLSIISKNLIFYCLDCCSRKKIIHLDEIIRASIIFYQNQGRNRYQSAIIYKNGNIESIDNVQSSSPTCIIDRKVNIINEMILGYKSFYR